MKFDDGYKTKLFVCVPNWKTDNTESKIFPLKLNFFFVNNAIGAQHKTKKSQSNFLSQFQT